MGLPKAYFGQTRAAARTTKTPCSAAPVLSSSEAMSIAELPLPTTSTRFAAQGHAV